MNRPRTIQIYLPDGNPRGVRSAELTTSIVRAIEVPRAMLEDFLGMPEAKQVGLYFLIGDEEDADYPSVYIGQTGNLGVRLTEHHNQKEFWNRALIIVSLTNSLTQTHALYLEWSAIKHANQAERYKVLNGNGGTKPHTPSPLEADCLEIYETLAMLIATLGQPVLEPLVRPREVSEKTETFYCKTTNYDAAALYTPEGMVVLKNSKARVETVPSFSQAQQKKRAQLIEEGALKQEGEFYVFQRDVLFKSPSGASDAVTGASTNGWGVWKNSVGVTLDDLKRKAPIAAASDQQI